MSWVIDFLIRKSNSYYQENYGWKPYLRRFETEEKAEVEALKLFNSRYSVKNYKVRELTPQQEENYEQRNFITG